MSNCAHSFLCYGILVLDNDSCSQFSGEWEVINCWLGNSNMEKREELRGKLMFDDFFAMVSGVEVPSDFGNDKRYDSDEQYRIKSMEYHTRRLEVNRTALVELVENCYDGYSQYVLAVTESLKSAYYDEVSGLGKAIVVQENWREILRLFCEKAKIPFAEPQWFLGFDLAKSK